MFGAVTRRARRGSPRIAVIGAGISGILVGIKLLEKGLRDFTIFEKGDDIGGTWRDNVYPGVACDVPSHLYVYSFEPNPDWTHRFAAGADIHRYYRKTAEKYGVVPHVRLRTEIAAADWQGDHWLLRTTEGETVAADILISAVGRLHHPSIPEIEGLDSFAGATFHSSRWRRDIDPAGKRVGVIGTGSSATQITATLSRTAQRLSLFQRTPQWVLAIPNDPLPRWMAPIHRYVPFASRLYYRRVAAQLAERTSVLNKGDRTDYDRAARASLDLIRDPELKARLTPDYAPGCKRMVRSPDFHEAIQRPNVELVSDPIDHVEPRGIVTRDGRLHELDVLVLATGFKVDAFMRPMTMTGEGGVSLETVWEDGPLNYRSVAIPQMPNFFLINGPYSPGGSASIVSIAEIDTAYIMQCIDKIVREKVAIAPRLDRSRELLENVRERASKTVWVTGGCNSWYLGKDGVPIVNPATLAELAEELRIPDFADFEVVAATGQAPDRLAA